MKKNENILDFQLKSDSFHCILLYISRIWCIASEFSWKSASFLFVFMVYLFFHNIIKKFKLKNIYYQQKFNVSQQILVYTNRIQCNALDFSWKSICLFIFCMFYIFSIKNKKSIKKWILNWNPMHCIRF